MWSMVFDEVRTHKHALNPHFTRRLTQSDNKLHVVRRSLQTVSTHYVIGQTSGRVSCLGQLFSVRNGIWLDLREHKFVWETGGSELWPELVHGTYVSD